MIRSFTALKFLPQALAMFACINSTAINAAVFPALLDQSDGYVVSLPGPSVVVPEGSFVDWLALGDIDNDGVLDYKFQVYSLLGSEKISSTNIACESVFIAASSFVDATFALSDATEIRGLATDSTVSNSCNVSSLPLVRLGYLPVQYNDGIEALYFDGHGNVSIGLDPGTVIVLNNLVVSNYGVTVGDNQSAYGVGDINGDGSVDVALEEYNGGWGRRAMIISGASLVPGTHLSFDSIDDENILFVERYYGQHISFSEFSDINGDSFGDLIVTTDYDHFFLYGSADIYVDNYYAQLVTPNLCTYPCRIRPVGDFNGDGFDDVSVAVGENSDTAVAPSFRIAYGTSEGLPLVFEVGNSTLIDLPRVVNDETEFFSRGNGDFNDDGASDLFFVSRGNESMVIFGQILSKPEIIDTAQLDGESGFTLIGADDTDFYSWTVIDVNNDGIDDVWSAEYGEVMLLGRTEVDDTPVDNTFTLEKNGHSVYSQTSHELFWNRATHPSGIVGYEVSLNNEVLTTIDATSFYVDNFDNAGSFEYKVTAIAADGSRSMYAMYIIEHSALAEQSPAAPQSASLGLRGEVYSSTAAELFWDTVLDSEGNSTTYQVSRNGNVYVVSDARSYFDTSLSPSSVDSGFGYDESDEYSRIVTYRVASINESGFEVAASSLELISLAEGGYAINPTNIQPTNARGLVYSSSALELFWDRSVEESISSYSIYRNGLLIGESSGTSFFDIGLNADTEYQYSIRAINIDGKLVGDEAIVVLQSES